jgi:2-polyprenyl-3-methyl-5-hydroxy-6-metoxy-1,4-benzoquinol methylase
MFFRKRTDNHIPGDYQYKALHKGPISQRLWHRQKLDLLAEYVSGGRYRSICDVGCGSGIVTDYVASLCPQTQVTGLDIKQECIEFASRHYRGRPNLAFLHQDALKALQPSLGAYDLVFSTEVIEHLDSEGVPRFLATLLSLGHDDTAYLISTPDYGSLWPWLERTMDALALTPKLKDHQHLTCFTKQSLSDALRSQGFGVRRIFNFCGWSPFLGHVSLKLSRMVENMERRHGRGFLIACEFHKA